MSKKGIIISSIVPLFLIIFLVLHLMWNQVPRKLAQTLSNALQTSVLIGDATIAPSRIGLQKIIINSPRKSQLSKAFSCENLNVNAPILEYIKDDIVIDLIELDDVYLGLEFDSPQSATGNWTRLMDNLSKSTDKEDPSRSSKNILIKKLRITNIKCQVVYLNKNDRPINLKPIAVLEFDNISSSSGFPVEQLSNSVLGKMLKQVFIQENLTDMLNKWVNPKESVPNILRKSLKLF
jgi:hypothetical protein